MADKDNLSACANKSQWTINTSKEVSVSFNQYFSGNQPDIGILKMAFANGHFHFCGANEINSVLDELYEIRKSGAKSHKDHLNDFIHKIEAIR
ncbi:MAG: hypothetical protein GY731_02865 [Gammaproteobacteria bacterium]|nr:hypothetical protein [Gammaproteobacteria bacterium]